MNESINPNLNKQINTITEELIHLSNKVNHPLVVAIDGASGSGKSTIAEHLRSKLQASILPLDDFFSMNIPDDEWDKFSTTEKLENVFDWDRVKNSALIPLRNNQQAQWHTFDFNAGLQPDGKYRLAKEKRICNPSKIILLEGSYSCSPFLMDIVNKTILIDVPINIRHIRISLRENSDFLEQWHKRWDAVESYYFEQVRPKTSFNWIIKG